MKITIFGASGKTGKLLAEQALEAGHQVTAYVRRPDALGIDHPGLRTIVGDLSDLTKLTEVITGADVCFSTLGGGSISKRSPELMAGIAEIVRIMEQEGVKRFIYLSSIGAGDSRYYMGPLMRLFIVGILLRVPLADHTANEKQIAAANLDWTLVRPVGLSDGPLTGSIRYGTEFIKLTGNSSVSRADVASFMLNEAVAAPYARKGVWLLGGKKS